MADIVLKDRLGTTEIYDEVEVVALTDSNGEEQLYYSEDKFNGYYTKEEVDSLIESADSLDNYYTKEEVDERIEKVAAESTGSFKALIAGSIEEDGTVTITFDESLFSVE